MTRRIVGIIALALAIFIFIFPSVIIKFEEKNCIAEYTTNNCKIIKNKEKEGYYHFEWTYTAKEGTTQLVLPCEFHLKLNAIAKKLNHIHIHVLKDGTIYVEELVFMFIRLIAIVLGISGFKNGLLPKKKRMTTARMVGQR